MVFQQLRKNVREEEALSVSEKMVRLVRDRTPDVENSHYTNMFLTEGWIGDSFSVGRKEEMEHLDSIVENWKLGFRGAVSITGKRFSGKTLFTEMISQRHFQGNTIHLIPNEKLNFEGRTFETTYNLKEVLNFITKYGLHSQAMILIDDLELWQDKKTSLGENVVNLLKTIDESAINLFFVVSMSNWLKTHLNQVFEIDKIFQGEINLDRMGFSEIQEAILIRHSATHMELINEDQEEVTGAEVGKIINRVCKNTEGNIGEALLRWSSLIRHYNEEQVVVKTLSNYALPEFINTDIALVLKVIMMEKRTGDYQLRKLFGPAFKLKYKVLIQRLLNLGILSRDVNVLEINPFLVNDIGRKLEEKMDFQFRNKKAYQSSLKL